MNLISDFDRALRNAAYKGDTARFRSLLAEGVDVHAFSGDGKNPLMRIVQHGTCNEECLRLLLAAGADVNAADNAGKTALMHAAAHCHECTVETLLAAGADVNATMPDGDSALSLAIQYRAGVGAIRLLLSAGACIGHPHAFLLLAGAAAMHRLDALKLLLAAGADTEAHAPGGVTPLMAVAERNQGSCVSLLLAAGAKVDARDNRGRTALMRAARKGYEDICSRLLSAGADPALVDDSGRSARDYANGLL